MQCIHMHSSGLQIPVIMVDAMMQVEVSETHDAMHYVLLQDMLDTAWCR